MRTGKIISIFLACLMLLPLFATAVSAASETEGLTDGGTGFVNAELDWYNAQDSVEAYVKIEGIQELNAPYQMEGKDGWFYAIRIVASHKNITEYYRFGFDVMFTYTDENGETATKSATRTSSTVYNSVNATVNGTTTKISASDFDADYISVVVVRDIPITAGAINIRLTPIVYLSGSQEEIRGTPTTGNTDYWGDWTLTTMTFNIRNWDTNAAHLQRIKTVIKENTPDVIGFQEMSNLEDYEWVDKLFADSEIANMYGYIGEERTDGTGEQCAIFYRKDKFSVMESNVLYLYCTHGVQCTDTECKGVEQAGNFSDAPDTAYNRLFTYARLKRLSDNKELIYMNTHLELSSAVIGDVKLQTKEVDYLINFAKDWIDHGYSVILTGDFNAGLTSATCQKLTNVGYKSAESESEKFIGQELPEGEIYASENRSMARGIDHIFVYSNTCYFDTYKYCDQKITVTVDGETTTDYPSDHIPRIATYIIW